MISGIKQYKVNFLLKIGLVALVVYFSQIYPYTHFHHAHTDSSAQIEQAANQADDDRRHHVHHGHYHDDDHDDSPLNSSTDHDHHHEFAQHVDWHVVRLTLSTVTAHLDFHSYDIVEAEPSAPTSGSLFKCGDSKPPAESIPIGSTDPRGPPSLG